MTDKRVQEEILRASEQAGFRYFRIIVEVTDGTCMRCLAGQGRLFALDELVMYDLLPPLHPHCRCMAVPTDETENGGAWYDPLVRIPADAKRLLDTFVATQQARLGEGTLSGVLDWLTMGLVSGFAQGLGDRWENMMQSPSLYHTTNWLTLGFAGEVRGAVAPEEPLSLEHWLHSIGVVSALYSAYAMGKGAAREYRQAAELEKMAGELGDDLDKLLMNELAESGAKYNADKVVLVTKTVDGKLLWLEEETALSGLQHIAYRHAENFADQGITDIPKFLSKILKTTPIKTGTTPKGLYADYIVNGQKYTVAYGTNGYIVLFYPSK